MNIATLLLAAGESRRFGSNKLRFAIDGKTVMLEHCARQLQRVCGNVTCVVRREDEDLIKLLQKEHIRYIYPDTGKAEFGNNIAAAVRATAEADAWIIALADMPYIRDETLSLVCSVLRTGAAIVVPTFESRHGHPVGFNKSARQRLFDLNGPRGAKPIFSLFEVTEIATGDPGVLIDIDTLADVRKQKTQKNAAIVNDTGVS